MKLNYLLIVTYIVIASIDATVSIYDFSKLDIFSGTGYFILSVIWIYLTFTRFSALD